jgi:hypothetical protein
LLATRWDRGTRQDFQLFFTTDPGHRGKGRLCTSLGHCPNLGRKQVPLSSQVIENSLLKGLFPKLSTVVVIVYAQGMGGATPMQVERSIDQELVPCVRNITPPLIWRGS